MDAGIKQLADILNGNRVLEVPYYQRSYVWKEEQWERLLSDMEYITNTGQDYFLGSIILKQEQTGISPYDLQTVIDGQQRFTTLALFFKSLCLKTDDLETFEGKFTVRDKKAKTRHIAIRHSINDRQDFEKVMVLDSDCKLETDVPSNIIDAYNYFHENIDPEKVDVDVLLNHIIFIGISLQAGEDEQAIFDTINSLGVKLTIGELLKNYFFTESTRQEYEHLWMPIFEKDRELANYWDSTINSGRIKRANIDFFFNAYLCIKIQDPSIKVSAEHKVRYRRFVGLFNNYKDLISTYSLDKKDMIWDILEYAQLYHDNINPEIANGEIPGKPGIERINFLIFVLEYTTLVPYILYILRNVPSEEERNEIFGYIESYVLRRQVCRSDNKNFSDLFGENLILNQILTIDDLCDYQENKSEEQALALPSDGMVRKGFVNSHLPNKRSLAILYLMETALREGKPHATKLYPFDTYSLEHLLPKNWQDNWPMLDGYDKDQRDDLKLCLGNLAMLPAKLNTSISNASWQTKKSGKGKSQGLLFYAADIVTMSDTLSLTAWNEKTIQNRAKWLAEKAMEIWPSYLPEDEEDAADAEDLTLTGKIKRNCENHDYTKFSLNGKPATAKNQFVLDVVRTYIDKHPSVTYTELLKVFHEGLCSRGHKHKGLLLSVDTHSKWDNKYKDRRYSVKMNGGKLVSGDGVEFYVNTQWEIAYMHGIIKLAKDEGFTVKAEK